MRTVVAAFFLVGGGWITWHFWERPPVRAKRLLAQALSLRSTGDHLRSERAAAAALELDPTLGEAALLAAECATEQNEFQRAVDYVRHMTSADPRIRVRAALFAAKLNYRRLYRLSDAEQAYRTALDLDPDNVDANAGLAKLLGVCGCRQEAIPHVLRIVRKGVATDLLIMLGRNDAVIQEPGLLERAREAAPEDPHPLVGLAWHAAESERTDQAIELLRDAIRKRSDHVAAHVALGRLLLESRRFDDLVPWVVSAPPQADESAETWLVRGRMAENEHDADAAIRCYGEAARRAPESKAVNFRLARLLAEVGEVEASERFADRVRQLSELETLQNRFRYSTDYLLELANGYAAVGRLWEAYGWCQMAVRLDASHRGARRRLEELRNEVEGIPLLLTVDTANVALAIDLSRYPLPRFREKSSSPTAIGSDNSPRMSFREDAAATGLQFRYFNGTAGPPSRRMFEFTGGGIGVLDFDLDGFSDVYFTQGRPWPLDTPTGQYGDRLFRNCEGTHFEDVTTSAGIREAGFGQGVTVGDFNADGFPDLYVANIGANQLWVNNGDGTFTDVTREAGVGGNEWTTSCVLADLDGDGLPDIYAVNYVTAEDVFERVCQHADGAPKLCMPFDFEGQPDRLWLNEGNGHFTEATEKLLSIVSNGKGLGAAVWDAEGAGRLSLLVANDTTPCFFFRPETAADVRGRLRERGIEAGLALNGDGKATGCMGIALGDVNDDGQLDVHITNFLGEPNTLFLNRSAGIYEDCTREVGLYTPSLNVLGFGTQFLDMDLDGRLELFVSNGHVDDLSRYGKPYRMPAQLFRWNQRMFVEISATELGAYFQKQWLGRPVARLDWNRDGRDDLVVGHLADESALLTNTTRDAGRFLSIRLVGVQSNRDAIGTTVQVRVGKRTIIRQVTAGDGYQASNERRLIFGVGNAEQIDEMVVRWPSGATQYFDNISTFGEAWLTEGRALLMASVVNE